MKKNLILQVRPAISAPGSMVAILLLLTAATTFAQKIEKYYDYQWHLTDVGHARFYSLLEKSDSGWHCRDYYVRDASLQFEGWYQDSDRKMAEGKCEYDYPDQTTEIRGGFVHGKKQGIWITYHPNGKMADSVVYDNGNPIGTGMAWFPNGYTADSTFHNADGSGVQLKWFDNGNPSSAGAMGPGFKKNGKWKFFHKNGQISALELYDQGKLLDKQYFDESGKPVLDTTSRDRPATYKAGMTSWLEYLGKHLHYPKGFVITNSDQAVVVIKMTIDEEGKIRDAFVRVPFYPDFDKIALDVIGKAPRWLPAMDHNRIVSAHLTQPVIFQEP
jgi:antitoxin component YwqK of YwqJK toxin-antitoxin module